MTSICAAPRHVYIDLGVNWCNTLELFRALPEVAQNDSRLRAPWLVFGWEASPLIAPYAEQCTHALTSKRQLPPPPVLPSGSTRELREYAPALNCSGEIFMKRWNLQGLGSKQLRRALPEAVQKCVYAALKDQLSRLTAEPSLSQNQSGMRWRLSQAQTCPSSTRYILIPGAAWAGCEDPRAAACPTWVKMYGGAEQMLRGGSQPAGRQHMTSADTHGNHPHYWVQQVDVTGWMLASFKEDDFVVLKMDIEGAEHGIVSSASV